MQVLDNLFRILKMLAADDRGYTLQELSDELGLCRRQVDRLVVHLEEARFTIWRALQGDGSHRLRLVGLPPEIARILAGKKGEG